MTGALAPFIESLIHQAFLGMGRLYESRELHPAPHPRWSMRADRRWDCHFSQTNIRNTVDGISDLTQAVGLAGDLPGDFDKVIAALFHYRNKMVHLGYEWPQDERIAFVGAKAAWPAEWFEQSTSGGEPWIFYVTEAFVGQVLKLIEEVLEAHGRHIRGVLVSS